jgi:hypothetical protein
MNELNQNFGVPIGNRVFTQNDQLQFGKFSGDLNPIHIDPALARKTIAGECIVHGINGFMYAINSLVRYKGITIDHFNVKFLKFIPLGIKIYCFWDDDKNELSIISEKTLYTSISVIFGPVSKDGDISTIKSDKPLITPRNLTIKECSEIIKEDLIFRGDIEIGKFLFPDLFETYDEIFVAELASTSEIVGMQTPGINSLFLSIKGNFSEKNLDPYYGVANCDLKFGVMKLLVNGTYLKAEIDVIYRPASKNLPSIEQIYKKDKGNEFENVDALIIGGSRGIGEITAKIIACGGGKVTISYNLGKQDAEKLQQEISNFGGDCNIFHLKIEDEFYLPNFNFNQIYYFATPKIITENPSISNTQLGNLYELYYVDAFHKLLMQVLENHMRTSIFYPSSTFINHPSENYLEYAGAKLKGELLCKEFIDTKYMRIIYPRIPRLATDQTLGLIPEQFEDSVDVLYPLIQTMIL